jgi:hypothetical protein
MHFVTVPQTGGHIVLVRATQGIQGVPKQNEVDDEK